MSRRLFVALPVPDPVTEALLDTQEGIAGARWQDADNLHITLRFIGEVDRHMHADVVAALESVPFRPFPLRISGVGHFEKAKQGKAIWARITATEHLTDLQHSVEMACRRAGLEAETRKFIPHITLARLNSGTAPIESWLTRHGTLAPPEWTAGHFSLYESNLTPQGAIYEKMETFGTDLE